MANTAYIRSLKLSTLFMITYVRRFQIVKLFTQSYLHIVVLVLVCSSVVVTVTSGRFVTTYHRSPRNAVAAMNINNNIVKVYLVAETENNNYSLSQLKVYKHKALQ